MMPLKSARRPSLWNCGQRKRVAHNPTGEQTQKKRTNVVLPKPDKLIRYRQNFVQGLDGIGGTRVGGGASTHAPAPRGSSPAPEASARLTFFGEAISRILRISRRKILLSDAPLRAPRHLEGIGIC
jgi:hypothetical protein